MGFKIDTRGLDKFQKKLRNLQRSVEPSTFNEWAKRIDSTARFLCNDPEGKRIKLRTSTQGVDKVMLNSSLQIKRR